MTPMTMELLPILISALAAAVAVGAFLRAGRRMHRADAVELESRLTQLEVRGKAMPTQKDVHDLAVSIEHLAGEVKAMNARHDGMASVVRRLEVITDRQETYLKSGAGG